MTWDIYALWVSCLCVAVSTVFALALGDGITAAIGCLILGAMLVLAVQETGTARRRP